VGISRALLRHLERAFLLTNQRRVALEVRHIDPRVTAAEVLVVHLEEPARYVEALEDQPAGLGFRVSGLGFKA